MLVSGLAIHAPMCGVHTSEKTTAHATIKNGPASPIAGAATNRRTSTGRVMSHFTSIRVGSSARRTVRTTNHPARHTRKAIKPKEKMTWATWFIQRFSFFSGSSDPDAAPGSPPCHR